MGPYDKIGPGGYIDGLAGGLVANRIINVETILRDLRWVLTQAFDEGNFYKAEAIAQAARLINDWK